MISVNQAVSKTITNILIFCADVVNLWAKSKIDKKSRFFYDIHISSITFENFNDFFIINIYNSFIVIFCNKIACVTVVQSTVKLVIVSELMSTLMFSEMFNFKIMIVLTR